jgi:hypothetical protein
MTRASLYLVSAILALLFCSSAFPAPAPAVLFVGFGPEWAEKPDEVHLQHLREAGFQVDATVGDKLTWDRLKTFNVVVFYNLPAAEAGGAFGGAYQGLPDLIARFVQAGGGFLNAGICATHGQNRVDNEFLSRWGLEVPYERLYETDPAKVYTMPSMFRHRFFLTTEIAPNHPVTAGVKALWTYAAHDGATLGEFPHPLKPGPDWTVLVWGSATCRSIRMPNFGELTDETKEPAATYAEKPPLMAVRTLGQGRMAATVINQSHLIENGWHFAYDGVSLAKGNGAIASDWEKLLTNTYRWLAEPSLASGAVGGFVAQAGPDSAAQALQAALRVGFDRAKFGPPTGNHYKGLIGARTAYSVGQGTVAEYVTAAKAAGYSWIVFTETYEKMTEDKWNRLVADCKAATADDFLAIPSLEYPDQCGDRFLSFGPAMGWIKPQWYERKRFGVNEDVNVNYNFPDTILFELSKNRLDPHYIGHYYSVAIETYRGPEQKLTENDLDQYARLQYLRYNLHPTAVHFVDAPGQVARAAQVGFQNWIRLDKLGDFYEYLTGGEARYSHVKQHPVRMYVSEGPRLEAWQGSGTALGARDRYLGGEAIQHWQARAAWSSDQPLREVRFQNGPDLLARYLPGQKSVDYVYHGFQDRQYEVITTAVDAAGRRAMSSCLLVLELRNDLVNCTDNRNIILGGDYGSSVQPPRGFEMYFSRPAFGCIPYDGPLLQNCLDKLQPLNGITDSEEYFTSKDIVILDNMLKNTWPPGLIAHGAKVNGYPEADDLPVEDFDYSVRTYRLTTGKDKPELLVVEPTVVFKRDLSFKEGVNRDLTLARFWSGRSVPEDFQALAVGDGDQAEIKHRTGDNLGWSGEIKPGQYLAALPGLTGAVALMPLDQPLLWWGGEDANRVDVHAGLDLPAQVKKGDRYTARFLYVVGKFGEPETSREFPELMKALGLAGPPAYQVTPDAGKVLDTRLLLTVQAQNRGFSGKISPAALPVDGLTVRVQGVNNNWSAGLWERGKKLLSRVGGRDGVVWANVDISQGNDVYIGNLLTCDAPDLRLILLENDEKGCAFQAHNPTDQAITATVRRAEKFDRVPAFEKKVTVPAGSTVEVQTY